MNKRLLGMKIMLISLVVTIGGMFIKELAIIGLIMMFIGYLFASSFEEWIKSFPKWDETEVQDED